MNGGMAILASSIPVLAPAAQEFTGVASAGGYAERIIEIFLLITTLSFAPALAMMATSLPLIVIVFSILRQGSGLPQSPPNMMIMGLAALLTWFVMEPVFVDSWRSGVEPFLEKKIGEQEALMQSSAPFREFMTERIDPMAISALSEARGDEPHPPGADTDFALLSSAFMLSEIQRAIQIGFVILLPFLVIDLLIASILMAMGMMMVPPSIVSLPFKLSFLVLTNGWIIISGALVNSYQ